MAPVSARYRLGLIRLPRGWCSRGADIVKGRRSIYRRLATLQSFEVVVSEAEERDT